MSFTQFCSNFEEKLDLKGAKAALDYVFGTERGNVDSYRPSRSDTKGFIRVLKTAILAEAKELSVERDTALDKILGYNENPGVSQFEGIDPPVFAFQLALRVREPSLLDQRYTGVCGASSLVTLFAKQMPAAFADYAISLMRSGEGKVYGRSVKATDRAMRGSYSGKMAAVDIVVLGTIGFDWFGITFASSEDICEWLTTAGFRNVRNNTKLHADELQLSLQKTTEWFRQNLDEAALFSNTKLVIIATDAELLKPLWQKKGEWTAGDILARKSGGYRVDAPFPKTIWNRHINHWTLVSRLSIDQKIVRIKLYTWGNSLQGTFDLEPFLSYYGGHIVADPPAAPVG